MLRLHRHPCKDAPGPAIGIHHRFLHQHVATEPWHQDRPYDVVQRPGAEQAKGHDAVQVVRQVLVHALALWRHVWSNHQVHVRQHEEDGDGQRCADSRLPKWKAGLAVHINPDKAGGDEHVDDGQRIGNEAGLVSIPQDKREGNAHLTRKL